MLKQYGPYRVQHNRVVTMPREVREALKLEPDGFFVWQIEAKGRGRKEVLLRKCYPIGQDGEGGVKVE